MRLNLLEYTFFWDTRYIPTAMNCTNCCQGCQNLQCLHRKCFERPLGMIDALGIRPGKKCKCHRNIIKTCLHCEMFLHNSYAFLSQKIPITSQNCKIFPPKSNIFLQKSDISLVRFPNSSRHGENIWRSRFLRLYAMLIIILV